MRGDAADALALKREEALILLLDQIGERGDLAALVLLGDLEDGGLGRIDKRLGAVGPEFSRVVGVIDDLPAGGDERAQAVLVGDDLGKVHRRGGARCLGGELLEIAHPADVGELLPIAQGLGEEHEVAGLLLVVGLDQGLVDRRVGLAIEGLGRLDDPDDLVDHRGLDDHGAEQGHLGKLRVRRRLVEELIEGDDGPLALAARPPLALAPPLDLSSFRALGHAMNVSRSRP